MVREKPFGAATLLTLSDGTVTVELLSFGAAVRSIIVPDRDGKPVDVCLGYDTLEEYRAHDGCLGACVGRHANRIAGAEITLDGTRWPLAANEGANQLHGGPDGFGNRMWDFTHDENSVTFTLHSPHLDQGFPGNLDASVRYALSGGTLTLTYRAVSDRDTVVNLTNHTYFNLSGHASGRVDAQELTVHAGRYTPCGEGNIPTGEILPVEGTRFDLRRPAPLAGRDYDHNFVLDGRAAAELYSPATGIALAVETTQPGVQVYTAGFLSERKGKGGAVYGPANAVCLETQHFPDAIHHADFPSPVLKAGAEYEETTSFRFYTR